MNDPSFWIEPVRLEIAGIVSELRSSDLGLVRALALRYSDFSTRRPAHVTVQINWQRGERSSADGYPEVQFDVDCIRLTAPDYAGYLDLKNDQAVLTLSSSTPIEDVDYFLRVIYAVLAFESGGLLLHAAAVVRNGRAYVFLGHSGSGKTTVARLSTGYQVLNDDLIILQPDRERWTTYGTPFWNPTQVKPTRQQAPLAMLLQLVKDKQVHLTALGLTRAVAEMVANVPVISADTSRGSRVVQRCLSIVKSAPGYSLHFLPDPSFWQVIGEAEGEF